MDVPYQVVPSSAVRVIESPATLVAAVFLIPVPAAGARAVPFSAEWILVTIASPATGVIFISESACPHTNVYVRPAAAAGREYVTVVEERVCTNTFPDSPAVTASVSSVIAATGITVPPVGVSTPEMVVAPLNVVAPLKVFVPENVLLPVSVLSPWRTNFGIVFLLSLLLGEPACSVAFWESCPTLSVEYQADFN